MKKRTIISAVFLSALLGWMPVHAQAACPRVAAPQISVRINDPGARVSSTKSLRQINEMAGSHGLARKGFKVLGITEVKIGSGVKVRYVGAPVGNSTCVSVSKMEINFGLKTHRVHLPREYKRGSCQFNVVLRHEMAHVDVNRRSVRKYAAALKNEMRSVLRRSGAVAASSMTKGQNVKALQVQKVLDDIAARFSAEVTQLHAAIDKPGGKYAADGKCKGW